MSTSTRSKPGSGSAVAVSDSEITIRIALPETATESDTGRAAQLLFAARADAYAGVVMWHRYQMIYELR